MSHNCSEVGSGSTPKLGVVGVGVERKVERLEHLLRNFIVTEPTRPGLGGSSPERRPEQRHLNEVVEVACLQ